MVSEKKYEKNIPEAVIHQILKLLHLDPNSPTHECIFSLSHNCKTLKECFSLDLNTISLFFNHPSDTEAGTTPKNISDGISKLKKDIFSLAEKLREIQCAFSNQNTDHDINMRVAHIVREDSIRHLGVSSGLLGCDFPHPIDKKIHRAISSLEELLPFFELSSVKAAKKISQIGTSSNDKNTRDLLVFYLCKIYKHYSGKTPMAWEAISSADVGKKVYGNVIPYLQCVLPYIRYGNKRSLTDIALQEKLERLREDPNYAPLWQKQ